MAIAFCLASCSPPKTLYSWDYYSHISHAYIKRSGDEKATERLIKTYQQIIDRQKGTRKTVPPGIYADYGFLLLQTDQTEKGIAMLKKETELYPESGIFIERVLKMYEE